MFCVHRAQAILAIDLGTSSVKALVVDRDGRLLSRSARPYPVTRPHSGWAEQDPADWWAATTEAVQEVVAQAPGASIAGIGLSGQMHGSVFVDSTGSPLRPAMIWEDARSPAEIELLTAKVGQEPIIEATGSAIAPGFQAASIGWVQHHEPDIWGRTAMVLLPKDFLRWQLTGTFATDPSDASGTCLCDVHSRDWSPKMLTAVEVDRNQLPVIIPSVSESGRLIPAAAARLGLPTGIPVSGGGGDAPLALLASGAIGTNSMLLTLSSGSQIMLPTPEPVIDPLGRIHSWCTPLEPESGAGWSMMAATLASGAALTWFLDQIAPRSGPDPFGAIDAEISIIPAGSDGVLFLPYLAGERSPLMDPQASGAFFGLGFRHDRRNLLRSILEGSILALQQAAQVFADLGTESDQIVLAGGGSRSQTWCQIVADVFGLPVSVDRVADSSAIGAAMTAAAMLNWLELPAGSWADRDERQQFEPVDANTRRYRELSAIFQDLSESTRGEMHRLHVLD